MNILEIYKTSQTALLVNKVRSVLTMLGVIIGVMSVILLISIGRGVQNYITDQFESLGANQIYVMPGKVSVEANRDPSESYSRNRLEEKHVKLIETQAGDYINNITPGLQAGETVTYKTKAYFSSLYGIYSVGIKMQNYDIKDGRPFTENEVKSKAKVAILGPKVKNELFPNTSSIGKKVKIADDYYEVIGGFKEKGTSFDEQILLPVTTMMDSLDLKNYTYIIISVKDENGIETATKQVERALLRDLKEGDYTVMSQTEILSSIQNILGMLTTALALIAAISLVVGGIGIMNIMLVSVTERTKEIGLRKAIGATPNDIVVQFLIESLMLSVGGGIMGILLGWGSSLIARGFIRTEVPWWAVLLAFSFSALVGMIFGTYPAVKAGQKDPIEALRYE